MWQWLNHTNSASSDHSFPWQELRFLSTDIWPFDEIPPCSRTWNSQRFHFMCRRMTHYFHRQLRTQGQETSVLLRSQIQSSVRLPRVLAWKSRGVCLADVAGVYSEASPLESQHLCKISWFCVSWSLQPSAFHPLGYKAHRFQPTHLPKRVIQSFRETVQMCPGECGERITGLYVQWRWKKGTEEKLKVSWRKNLCLLPRDDTSE